MSRNAGRFSAAKHAAKRRRNAARAWIKFASFVVFFVLPLGLGCFLLFGMGGIEKLQQIANRQPAPAPVVAAQEPSRPPATLPQPKPPVPTPPPATPSVIAEKGGAAEQPGEGRAARADLPNMDAELDPDDTLVWIDVSLDRSEQTVSVGDQFGLDVEAVAVLTSGLPSPTIVPRNGEIEVGESGKILLEGGRRVVIDLKLERVSRGTVDDVEFTVTPTVETFTGRFIPLTNTNLGTQRRRVLKNGRKIENQLAALSSELVAVNIWLGSSANKSAVLKAQYTTRRAEIIEAQRVLRESLQALERQRLQVQSLEELAYRIDREAKFALRSAPPGNRR